VQREARARDARTPARICYENSACAYAANHLYGAFERLFRSRGDDAGDTVADASSLITYMSPSRTSSKVSRTAGSGVITVRRALKTLRMMSTFEMKIFQDGRMAFCYTCGHAELANGVQ